MKILFPHFSWLQEELSYSNGVLSEAFLTSKSVLHVEGQSAIIPYGMSKLYFEVDHLRSLQNPLYWFKYEYLIENVLVLNSSCIY